MKPLFLFLALSCLSLVSIAQSKGNIRLYGYKQYVSGGKRPQSANNSGPVTSAGAGKNYFLYAVSSSRIYPSEIWIEGVRYGVTIKTISKTPVEMSEPFGADGPKKVLVPSTKEKVVQLIPNSASTTKSLG